MTGSPMAPSARLESVMPSWIAEMNRAGFACRPSTRRADLLPSDASSCMRVRRAVTNAYSADTKNALPRTINTTASSSSAVVMPDWYSEARRSSEPQSISGFGAARMGQETGNHRRSR